MLSPISVSELVARIPNGATIALPADYSGCAMTAVRALIARGVRDLHLVCMPQGGFQVDWLVGSGCVARIEAAAVTLGEHGIAPRFDAAIKSGEIEMWDSTCPALLASLQAGEKGLPFIPLRGLIGTDVLARRDDWKVIDNPFSSGDPVALLPAIRPDAALFHAPMADRNGNVYIGRNRDLLTMAQASHECFVTVEKIVDEDLMADPARSPGVIPAIYVSGVAIAERGAVPLRFLDDYPADETVLSDYARMARTDEGFRTWLARWLGPADLSTAA